MVCLGKGWQRLYVSGGEGIPGFALLQLQQKQMIE